MEKPEANGWFEKYVVDKLDAMGRQVGALSKDIKAVHNSPCPTVITVDKKVARLEASTGSVKWILRGFVFGLFCLLAAFLLK